MNGPDPLKPRPLRGAELLAAMGPSGSGGHIVPFASVLADLHNWMGAHSVSYCVIGGVASARSGSARTTGDIDVLVSPHDWRHRDSRHCESDTVFETGQDWMRHVPSGTPVDVLFAHDDWELPFLLPAAAEVREWDDALGCWFMQPRCLLLLKAAVYQSKLEEFGRATAAKDLADVYSLLSADRSLCTVADDEAAAYPTLAGLIEEVCQELPARPPQ